MAAALVLVVDDDDDLTRLMRRLIEAEFDCDVVTAQNGREALDRCDPSPDLVVADLMMPHMDGEDFLVEYRRRYPDRKTPVVLVTASAISEQVAERIGVQALLKKPFDSEDLLALVREFVPRP